MKEIEETLEEIARERTFHLLLSYWLLYEINPNNAIHEFFISLSLGSLLLQFTIGLLTCWGMLFLIATAIQVFDFSKISDYIRNKLSKENQYKEYEPQKTDLREIADIRVIRDYDETTGIKK